MKIVQMAVHIFLYSAKGFQQNYENSPKVDKFYTNRSREFHQVSFQLPNQKIFYVAVKIFLIYQTYCRRFQEDTGAY